MQRNYSHSVDIVDRVVLKIEKIFFHSNINHFHFQTTANIVLQLIHWKLLIILVIGKYSTTMHTYTLIYCASGCDSLEFIEKTITYLRSLGLISDLSATNWGVTGFCVIISLHIKCKVNFVLAYSSLKKVGC